MVITEWILNVPNSEKERLIKTVENKKKQDIIFDRIINGMTYESILLKYYPEYGYQSEISKLRECRKIRKMVDRFVMKQINSARK
mgnify:CR=1 FL=1